MFWSRVVPWMVVFLGLFAAFLWMDRQGAIPWGPTGRAQAMEVLRLRDEAAKLADLDREFDRFEDRFQQAMKVWKVRQAEAALAEARRFALVHGPRSRWRVALEQLETQLEAERDQRLDTQEARENLEQEWAAMPPQTSPKRRVSLGVLLAMARTNQGDAASGGELLENLFELGLQQPISIEADGSHSVHPLEQVLRASRDLGFTGQAERLRVRFLQWLEERSGDSPGILDYLIRERIQEAEGMLARQRLPEGYRGYLGVLEKICLLADALRTLPPGSRGRVRIERTVENEFRAVVARLYEVRMGLIPGRLDPEGRSRGFPVHRELDTFLRLPENRDACGLRARIPPEATGGEDPWPRPATRSASEPGWIDAEPRNGRKSTTR